MPTVPPEVEPQSSNELEQRPEPDRHPLLELFHKLIETAPAMIRESTPVVLAIIALITAIFVR